MCCSNNFAHCLHMPIQLAIVCKWNYTQNSVQHLPVRCTSWNSAHNQRLCACCTQPEGVCMCKYSEFCIQPEVVCTRRYSDFCTRFSSNMNDTICSCLHIHYPEFRIWLAGTCTMCTHATTWNPLMISGCLNIVHMQLLRTLLMIRWCLQTVLMQ